jgi:hypothetical protein
MSAPSGYTALDFVGFTDKGTYSPIVTYMRNDLVHYGGNIMRCLIDNTKNVTPVVGANWELWVGASANLVERVIAPLENNPADVAFGVGRQIIYDDWLWEVIAPIAVGDALIDYAVDPTNANIKKSAPVETQLLAVKAEADATDNMIAPTETNASSSSAAYAVGDQLILNNILYDVIAAIQIGDALITGTGGNIAAADSLTEQLAAKANSSDFATVATSGSYNDLSDKPTLGTAAAKNSTNAVTQSSTDLVESGAVYSEIDSVKQALTTTNNVLGAKNLCPNDAVNQTINGITFNINRQVYSRNYKAMSVAGTNDGTALSILVLGTTNLERGTYILSGCPSGGSGATWALNAYNNSGINVVDYGNGATINIEGDSAEITIRFIVYRNATISASIFPMIRPSSVSDDTYVPYAKTNREITSQLTKLAESETQTVAGITFKRIGESVVYYGNLTGLANTSYVNIGIAPFLPTEAYSIDNFYDLSAPYTPIGTIWINGNGGAMTIYKDSAKTSGYVSGSYICHL